MNKRKITNLNNLKFKPFDKYGETIKGWTWHKINFDEKNFPKYLLENKEKYKRWII